MGTCLVSADPTTAYNECNLRLSHMKHYQDSSHIAVAVWKYRMLCDVSRCIYKQTTTNTMWVNICIHHTAHYRKPVSNLILAWDAEQAFVYKQTNVRLFTNKHMWQVWHALAQQTVWHYYGIPCRRGTDKQLRWPFAKTVIFFNNYKTSHQPDQAQGQQLCDDIHAVQCISGSEWYSA